MLAPDPIIGFRDHSLRGFYGLKEVLSFPILLVIVVLTCKYGKAEVLLASSLSAMTSAAAAWTSVDTGMTESTWAPGPGKSIQAFIELVKYLKQSIRIGKNVHAMCTTYSN